MTELSERRAKDRQQMAAAVVELARRYDCEIERREGNAWPGPRCIQVALTAPGGLQVTAEFDGASCQPDVHVLSWHMSLDSEAKLNPATFGGDVNPHHFRKATYVGYGFAQMMSELERGLRMCHQGTAYQAS
jgi:hypothetical protein